jgi:hypothetical protein
VLKKLTAKQQRAANKLAKAGEKLTAKQQRAADKVAAKVKALLKCPCGFTG